MYVEALGHIPKFSKDFPTCTKLQSTHRSMNHSKHKRFNVKTWKGKTMISEIFYFNSKELQAEVKVFSVITDALGFCLFHPLSLERVEYLYLFELSSWVRIFRSSLTACFAHYDLFVSTQIASLDCMIDMQRYSLLFITSRIYIRALQHLKCVDDL